MNAGLRFVPQPDNAKDFVVFVDDMAIGALHEVDGGSGVDGTFRFGAAVLFLASAAVSRRTKESDRINDVMMKAALDGEIAPPKVKK